MPSFIRMRVTWVFTVVSPTNSSPAISAFERPRAMSRNTSSSRGVSSAIAGGGSRRAGDVRANSWMSRRVADGARRASPRATRRLPAAGRRGGGDEADAVGELVGGDVLEEEPAGARAQRVVDVLVEVERREHEHADRRS